MCADQTAIAFFKTKQIRTDTCCLKLQDLLSDIFKACQAFDQIHIVILRNGIRHVGCNNCLDQCAVFRQSLFLLDLADCVICQKTAGHIACQRMVNTFSVLHSDTETVCIRICCKNKICIYFLRQL